MSKTEQSSRKLSVIIIVIVLAIWMYSLWSDRVTPITSIARVHSYLVRVAPEVSGNIVEVKIKNNQVVRAGDVMFRVDARNYELAVRSAQANLELAGQNIGASTAAVEVAQAKVTDALAARNNAREQAARVSELATKGVLSQSELDNAVEARSRAQAALNAAEASLQQAKQNLGPKGNNNPQILAAMVSLEKAQLDLQKTSVSAPSDGIVTNVQLTRGPACECGHADANVYRSSGNLDLGARQRKLFGTHSAGSAGENRARFYARTRAEWQGLQPWLGDGR